jgi:hypothetical protein
MNVPHAEVRFTGKGGSRIMRPVLNATPNTIRYTSCD